MRCNMCPPCFTRQAVEGIRKSARAAHRPEPGEVVQYVPCAVRTDRAQAHVLATATIAQMLPGFWPLRQRAPAAKSALLRAAHLSEADFAAAVDRLRAGEPPADA